MKRVGIYSGTFDPVHHGHLAFALEATQSGGLEKVYFLVEQRPRRKQGVKQYQHRLAMMALALADQPPLGSIIIDQDRFTIAQTLPLLIKRLKGCQLAFLLGDDGLEHLAGWDNLKDLLVNTQLIIGQRHQTTRQIKDFFGRLKKDHGLSADYTILQLKDADFSSRVIRVQLKKSQPTPGLPPAVLGYIQQHQLYASRSNE